MNNKHKFIKLITNKSFILQLKISIINKYTINIKKTNPIKSIKHNNQSDTIPITSSNTSESNPKNEEKHTTDSSKKYQP